MSGTQACQNYVQKIKLLADDYLWTEDSITTNMSTVCKLTVGFRDYSLDFIDMFTYRLKGLDTPIRGAIVGKVLSKIVDNGYFNCAGILDDIYRLKESLLAEVKQ